MRFIDLSSRWVTYYLSNHFQKQDTLKINLIFPKSKNFVKLTIVELRSAFANADLNLHYINRLRSALANADLNMHYINRLRSALANADLNLQYSNRLRSRIHKFVVSQTLWASNLPNNNVHYRALVRNFNPWVPLIKGVKILRVPGNCSPGIL